jgi:tRNA nucleotidyltransferase (CCA-adding enzyme)
MANKQLTPKIGEGGDPQKTITAPLQEAALRRLLRAPMEFVPNPSGRVFERASQQSQFSEIPKVR